MSLAAPRRGSAIVLTVACVCLPTLASSTPAHAQQRGAARVQATETTPVTPATLPSPAPVALWPVFALIVVAAVALVVRAPRDRRPGARKLGLAGSLNPASRLAVAPGGLARASRRAFDDREPVRLCQTKGIAPEPERRSAPAGTGGRGAPTPPDRGRAWIAEIEWAHADGVARFQVLAANAQGTAVTIAESRPLKWPPSGPDSVQAMSRAADELEAAMLAAGWKSLPPGEAWYAKRFEWPRPAAPRGAHVAAPAVAGPEPAAPAVTADDAAFELGRSVLFMRVPWPKGAEQLWRCEIRWHAGYMRSRFEAVALTPARRRGQPIGQSATFKWLMMSDPTPQEFQGAVDELTDSLASAGWERIPDGAAWYSRRFVWHRDSPPGRLDAGQGSAREIRQ